MTQEEKTFITVDTTEWTEPTPDYSSYSSFQIWELCVREMAKYQNEGYNNHSETKLQKLFVK